jgi:hypothetical protein
LTWNGPESDGRAVEAATENGPKRPKIISEDKIDNKMHDICVNVFQEDDNEATIQLDSTHQVIT